MQCNRPTPTHQLFCLYIITKSHQTYSKFKPNIPRWNAQLPDPVSRPGKLSTMSAGGRRYRRSTKQNDSEGSLQSLDLQRRWCRPPPPRTLSRVVVPRPTNPPAFEPPAHRCATVRPVIQVRPALHRRVRVNGAGWRIRRLSFGVVGACMDRDGRDNYPGQGILQHVRHSHPVIVTRN